MNQSTRLRDSKEQLSQIMRLSFGEIKDDPRQTRDRNLSVPRLSLGLGLPRSV
jgi:hypothetical protein